MANEDISKDSEDYAVSPSQQSAGRSGPFLAKVISHLDPTYMGILQVELLKPVGNSSADGQTIAVKMMTPFAGSTSVDYTGEEDDYDNSQKSYGMWFVPPDPGTIVVVFFIDGDQKRGYWMGCVLDDGANFMLPGMAATQQVVEGGGRFPTTEYNKKVNDKVSDPTMIKKPKHKYLSDVLEIQGLIKDDIRGITTSSARRETPSAVFGISTPGPIDKNPGAKKGKVGNAGDKVTTYVSRLGGSTFVMDDGDDKFLRKTKASDGPPEYAAVEQGETGGLKDIPHNELVRIRTRTGHQILLHNSEDLIYIANARGTAWIELTSNGKIDIYAADSISMHTVKDFNITADGDINLTSGGNVNVNSGGKLEVQNTGTDIDGGNINLNSGTASAPKAPRVPDHEPWAGHENLHDTALKYTTTTDTFSKIKPPEESN